VLVLLNDDEDSSEHLSASCSQATPAPTSPKDLHVYNTVYSVQVLTDISIANVIFHVYNTVYSVQVLTDISIANVI